MYPKTDNVSGASETFTMPTHAHMVHVGAPAFMNEDQWVSIAAAAGKVPVSGSWLEAGFTYGGYFHSSSQALYFGRNNYDSSWDAWKFANMPSKIKSNSWWTIKENRLSTSEFAISAGQYSTDGSRKHHNLAYVRHFTGGQVFDINTGMEQTCWGSDVYYHGGLTNSGCGQSVHIESLGTTRVWKASLSRKSLQVSTYAITHWYDQYYKLSVGVNSTA